MIPIAVPVTVPVPVTADDWSEPPLTDEQKAQLEHGQYFVKIWRLHGRAFPWRALLKQYPHRLSVDRACASTRWGLNRAVKHMIRNRTAGKAEVIKL